MGITSKLEKLRSEMREELKHNFSILADEIAKIRLNMIKLAEVCQHFGNALSILKKKNILTEEDYRKELEDVDNNNKDKKVSEESDIQSEET